jgi:hypothetical protein
MKRYAPLPKNTRKTARFAAAMVIIVAAIVGTLVYQTALSSKPSSEQSLQGEPVGATTGPDGETDQSIPSRPPRRDPDGPIADDAGIVPVGDGMLPAGVTVFDDEYPGVANLSPELLGALRAAATDAARDGIEFSVNSGWRSPAYQNQLLREAVAEYGSEAEAARWVATAETSSHVSGDAVDIGPAGAATWLSEHGVAYGLCQIYGNEPWPFELRPQASDSGCPPMYTDPTQDPRMQVPSR